MSDGGAKAFHKYWNRFFWSSKNLKHDKLIPEIAKRVFQDAKKNGNEQFYVTGRTKKLQSATLKQLRDAGLPFADKSHLFMKKNVQVKTLPWKIETVNAIGARRYGTESARDIDAMIAAGKEGVYSDFAMKPHGPDGPASKSRLEVIKPRSTYRKNSSLLRPRRKSTPSRERSRYRTIRAIKTPKEKRSRNIF